MADAGALVRSFGESVKASRRLQCTFCGTETPVVGVFSFCSWCENIIFKQSGDIERTDVWRGEVLNRIRARMAEERYDDVISAYNELSSISSEAGIQYAMALTLIKYSNYETSRIGYEKEGFMEGNIAHRDKARDLYSQAKMRLNKAISIANIAITQDVHKANNLFVIFLCQIKLGKLKAAASTMGKIRALNEGYIQLYCELLLDIALGKFAAGLEICQKLATGQNFTPNAYYYAAFCLFKMGKKHDANLILSKIRDVVPIESITALQARIAGLS